MVDLTALVQEHFDGKKEVHISWEKPSYFSLDIDEWHMGVRMEGRYRAGVSPRKVAPVMGKFIESAFGGDKVCVSDSSFRVALSNGQRMEVEHRRVKESDGSYGGYFSTHYIDHYVVDLYALEGRQKTRLMPVLAKIAEKVYGFALGKHYVTGGADHPFKSVSSVKKIRGYDCSQYPVSFESGLKHGTDGERKAYEALRKVRKHLSRKELEALKAYDPALVEKQPVTRHARGIIIQERCSRFSSGVNSNDFCRLSKKLPSSVRELPLIYLSSEDNGYWESVNLTASPIYRGNLPRLEYFAEKSPLSRDSENKSKIDDFVCLYQKISGMSDKQLETAVARAAKKCE